jgi:hypothetical protein
MGVDITPQMIQSGVLALEQWDARIEAPEWIREQIVASVYEAMAADPSRGRGSCGLLAMAKSPKKEKQQNPAKPPHMPFDDALRVLLNTRPKHVSKKKGTKK